MARILEGRWPRVGYFAWVQAPMSATRLSAVEGLDAVAALPHVASVARNQRQGDPLDWATGGRSNVCEVFGSVENVADLAAARDEIDDAIKLEFDESPRGPERRRLHEQPMNVPSLPMGVRGHCKTVSCSRVMGVE